MWGEVADYSTNHAVVRQIHWHHWTGKMSPRKSYLHGSQIQQTVVAGQLQQHIRRMTKLL